MDNSMSNQKLRFRIVECSGEDPQHPVSELLSGSPQSNGWHSQRFCTFPQSITFQFLTPVRLRQLQFLSHESKIASKLELFIAIADTKSPFPSNELQFKRLGYLSLDQNDKSGYQLRELKTVYIDAPCVYLRILFEKCHTNKFNFFHQVGLIAMAAFGEPLNSSPIPPPKSLNQSMEKTDRNERVEKIEKLEQVINQQDEFVPKKIKELEETKAKAIEAEEFEEAQHLKNELIKLKQMATQLQRFEERKNVALQNDDLETANTLKREIDRLRDTMSLCGSPQKNRLGQPSKPEKSLTTHNSLEQSSQKESLPEIPEVRPSIHKKQSIKEQSQGVKSIHIKSNEEMEEMGDEDEKSFENEEDTYQQEEKENNNLGESLNYDEQIIPALKKRQNETIHQEEYPQVGLPSEAENIAPEYQRMAEPVISVIGEELCKKVFSKHWNLREEALKQLINELPKGSQSKVINHLEPSNTFLAILSVISFTIVDRITQTSSKAMALLKILMTQKTPSIPAKSELSIFTDKILNNVLEKLGDSSIKVREQAEDTLLSLAKNSVITCYTCVISICRLNSPKGKSGPAVRHSLGRLKVLRSLVKEFKINNHDVPYNHVIEYVLDKVEHPNSDVRTSVINLLVEIYKLVGDKITSDLKGLSLAAREMLEREFEIMKNGGNPIKNNERERGNRIKNKMNASPAKNEKNEGKSSKKAAKNKSIVGKNKKLESSPSKGNGDVLPCVNGQKNNQIINNPKLETGKGVKGKLEALPNVNGLKQQTATQEGIEARNKLKSDKESSKNSQSSKRENENARGNKAEEIKFTRKESKDQEGKDTTRKNEINDIPKKEKFETKGKIHLEKNENEAKGNGSKIQSEEKKGEVIQKKPLNQPNQENSKRKVVKS